MIYEHHGIKPIVLIDEYDSSINNAYNTEPYDKVLEFLNDFYSSILKGNDYFEFAALTGVMQIAKEGIFSGLNDLVSTTYSVPISMKDTVSPNQRSKTSVRITDIPRNSKRPKNGTTDIVSEMRRSTTRGVS